MKEFINERIEKQIRQSLEIIDGALTASKSLAGAIPPSESSFERLVYNIDQYMTSIGMVDDEDVERLGHERETRGQPKEWESESEGEIERMPTVKRMLERLNVPWEATEFDIPGDSLRRSSVLRKTLLHL